MAESTGGTSLLETPPYIIALVFLTVLLITQGFEVILEKIRKQMEKHNKKGLLAAMNNMTTELMLLGVATLILVAFQPNIGRICVQAKRYVGKAWLDNVHGCACCLAQTTGVSECYLQARGCVSATDLQSCCSGGLPSQTGILNFQFKDDTRVCADLLAGGLDNTTQAMVTNASEANTVVIAAEAGRHLLGAATAAEAGSTTSTQCAGPDGKVQVGWAECPLKNSRPAIGALALHQIHLFIFILGIMHILLAIGVIVLAALRVKVWKHWKSHEDAHVLAVHAAVTEHKRKLGLLDGSAIATTSMTHSRTPSHIRNQGALLPGSASAKHSRSSSRALGHALSRRLSGAKAIGQADGTGHTVVLVDAPTHVSPAVLQRRTTEKEFLGKLQRARTILKHMHGSGGTSGTDIPQGLHGELLHQLELEDAQHAQDAAQQAQHVALREPSYRAVSPRGPGPVSFRLGPEPNAEDEAADVAAEEAGHQSLGGHGSTSHGDELWHDAAHRLTTDDGETDADVIAAVLGDDDSEDDYDDDDDDAAASQSSGNGTGSSSGSLSSGEAAAFATTGEELHMPHPGHSRSVSNVSASNAPITEEQPTDPAAGEVGAQNAAISSGDTLALADSNGAMAAGDAEHALTLSGGPSSKAQRTPRASKRRQVDVTATAANLSGVSQRWSGRRPLLRHALHRAEELLHCILRQGLPNIISREELSIMRASFHLTHAIDTHEFDFMAYLTESMDDDFARIVGLGTPMWIFIIVFILLSHEIGWCIWVFIILAGGLLFIVNTKLVWIARYVSRGGHVHRLKPGIFWLNRPWLLLPVIKFLTFFVSFVYSNSIFFTTQFGPKSCFFSRTGFQGDMPFPWWALLLVNTVYFASLSCVTLPLFSLVVQMGGDYKAALLPPALAARFEQAASLAEAKKKRGTLQRLVSGMLPMQKVHQHHNKHHHHKRSRSRTAPSDTPFSPGHERKPSSSHEGGKDVQQQDGDQTIVHTPRCALWDSNQIMLLESM